MLGSAITASSRLRQSGSSVTMRASFKSRVRSTPSTFTLRPSSFSSSSGTSRAITSMTLSFNASSAERLTASRTACSAHSTLRPRICARLRIYAAASLICLCSIAEPEREQAACRQADSCPCFCPSHCPFCLSRLAAADRPARADRRCPQYRFDRRGSAQIGGRSHCGDVACIEDIGARTRGPRAFGRDEGGNGNRRSDDLLDDLPHCGVQTARRVHFQHDQAGLLPGSGFYAPHHIVRRPGADRPVDVQHHHNGRRPCRTAQPGKQQQAEQQSAHDA